MRTEIVDGVTVVTLSRRNLRALLAKLDEAPDGSMRTLYGPSFYPLTAVRAEEDDEHYRHASRDGAGPGPLHPDTERKMLEDLVRDAAPSPS